MSNDFTSCSYVSDPKALVKDFEDLLVYELVFAMEGKQHHLFTIENAIHQMVGYTECLHSLGIISESEALNYQVAFRNSLID